MDRQSATWMKREDERILEFLDEEGLASARLISSEVFRKVSPGHVSERLVLLQDAKLVAKTGYTSYELTEKGERYLDGDVDMSLYPVTY